MKAIIMYWKWAPPKIVNEQVRQKERVYRQALNAVWPSDPATVSFDLPVAGRSNDCLVGLIQSRLEQHGYERINQAIQKCCEHLRTKEPDVHIVVLLHASSVETKESGNKHLYSSVEESANRLRRYLSALPNAALDWFQGGHGDAYKIAHQSGSGFAKNAVTKIDGDPGFALVSEVFNRVFGSYYVAQKATETCDLQRIVAPMLLDLRGLRALLTRGSFEREQDRDAAFDTYLREVLDSTDWGKLRTEIIDKWATLDSAFATAPDTLRASGICDGDDLRQMLLAAVDALADLQAHLDSGPEFCGHRTEFAHRFLLDATPCFLPDVVASVFSHVS